MLSRILAGFLRLDGVEQAMLFSVEGHLIASVGDEGKQPPATQAQAFMLAAFEAAVSSNLGTWHEVWIEQDTRMMIDAVGEDRRIVLFGQGGRLARWRHAIDHNRGSLATTPL